MHNFWIGYWSLVGLLLVFLVLVLTKRLDWLIRWWINRREQKK